MDWLALYGAIVGTVAFGWQIYTNVREQPNLQLLSPTKESYTPAIGSTEPFAPLFRITYEVAFLNTGNRPITIVAADVNLSAVTDDPSSTEPRRCLFVYDSEIEPKKGVRIGDGVLPLTIPGGEARHVPIVCRFERASTDMFEGEWYNGTFTFKLTTTAGVVERNAEFHVASYPLNYKLRRYPGT